MRLLIVTRESREDRRYGLGKSIGKVADGLRDRGHQVDYLARYHCEDFHQKWHSRLTRLLSPLGNMSNALSERIVQGAAAVQYALEHQHSHLWVHDPWMVLGIRLGLLRKGRLKRPFKLVVSEHGLGSFAWATAQDGLNPSPALYRFLLRLERGILHGCDTVFCPSEAVLQALKRDISTRATPAHWKVLGYGRPEQELPERSTARQQLGLAPDTFVVSALGRLAPVKQYNRLVQAVAALQATGIQIQLIIAGGGDIEAFCQATQCNQLTPPPLLGALENPAIALAAADVYVSVCAVESFGMANREALMSGTASIIAAGGGSNEVLDNGAWLIPGNVKCLKDSLLQLHDNAALRQFWSEQAKRISATWPSWNKIIERYEFELLQAG